MKYAPYLEVCLKINVILNLRPYKNLVRGHEVVKQRRKTGRIYAAGIMIGLVMRCRLIGFLRNKYQREVI